MFLSQIKTFKDGCIDLPELTFKCYCIIKDKIITDTGFAFPKTTYLYGKWVEDYSINTLSLTYRVEHEDYVNCGKISETLYFEVLKCLHDSSSIKRKYRKMIEGWLKC